MEIVSAEVHRVLAYVEALNRHGVRPPADLVNQFASRPDQRTSRTVARFEVTAVRAVERALRSIQTETVGGETFTQYGARLGWFTAGSDVEVTAVGRALLKALNSPTLGETSADVFEIVLEADDPFAYPQALSALSVARDALLVEPYFRFQQLHDIAEFDNITRVLIGPNLNKTDLGLLAHGLAVLERERSVEVRIARALHDRYVIPRTEGSVLMLGMSLGGIGKKVSTITTIGDLASIALREVHEALWDEAKILEPKTALPGTPSTAEREPMTAEPAAQPADAGQAPAKKTAKSASAKKAAAKRIS